MTTIVIDRIKGTITSDSRASWEEISGRVWNRKTSLEVDDNTRKIFSVGRGAMIVGTGNLGLLLEIHDRYCLGVNPRSIYSAKIPDSFKVYSSEELSDTYVYLCTKRDYLGKSMKVLKLTLSPKRSIFGKTKVSVKKETVNFQYTIAGSGKEFATGACEAMKSLGEVDPEKCVAAAIKHDPYSGGEIVTKIV